MARMMTITVKLGSLGGSPNFILYPNMASIRSAMLISQISMESIPLVWFLLSERASPNILAKLELILFAKECVQVLVCTKKLLLNTNGRHSNYFLLSCSFWGAFRPMIEFCHAEHFISRTSLHIAHLRLSWGHSFIANSVIWFSLVWFSLI